MSSSVLARRPPASDGHRSALRRELRSGLAGSSAGLADGADLAKGKVLNDDRADWREAWALFPGDVAYVWHGALHAADGRREPRSLPASPSARQIIWDKMRLVIGRGDYHWQHEPAWYAVRKGRTGHWAGGRNQTTVWQIPHRKYGSGHGTEKPVECMKRPIENNSSPGQAVYEPFSGSGTTIIAAEMTGRACHAIELNPAYVDVAVKRWQALHRREGGARRRAAAPSPRSRRSEAAPIAHRTADSSAHRGLRAHPGARSMLARRRRPMSAIDVRLRAAWIVERRLPLRRAARRRGHRPPVP